MELKIGELAKEVGVNIQTVRYYEQRGLLVPTARMESGYRIYDSNAKKRLEFIRYSKKLGFTLKETEELLKLRASATSKCADIKKKAENKISEIDGKLEGLQSMRKVLKEMVDTCNTGQPTGKCPILKTIENSVS